LLCYVEASTLLLFISIIVTSNKSDDKGMTMEQNLNAKYQKNKTKAQNNITTTLKCEDVVKHQDDEIGNLFVVFLG